MFCSGAIDWNATAAWAQAAFSGLAIFAAVWLQDRKRRKDYQERSANRLSAIKTIADTCVGTLRKLNDRAAEETLTTGRYGYYADELEADLASILAVDLAQLDDASLGEEVIKLRRLMRTANRRLVLNRAKIRRGEPIAHDRFRSIHKQALKAAEAIAKMKPAT